MDSNKKFIEKDLQEVISHVKDNDWFLEYFVDCVNMSGDSYFSTPVTIFVGGSIISGDMIGGKEYFSLIGKFISESSIDTDIDQKKELEKMFSSYGDKYEKKEEDSEIPEPNFIHLKNAKIYQPGQRPIPNNGLLWRGKINSVDGFSFGKFQLGK